MADDLITIAVTKRDYATGRSIARGRSIPLLMEDALRRSLQPIAAGVRDKLPGHKLRSGTKLVVARTPKGASARLRIRGPFAAMFAKYGTEPTVIKPKAPNMHLAIPLSSFAKGKQRSVNSLWEYGDQLKPRGHSLSWGKSRSPAFVLVHQAVVKPRVDLNDVKNEMSVVASDALAQAFNGYDFGYLSQRRIKR